MKRRLTRHEKKKERKRKRKICGSCNVRRFFSENESKGCLEFCNFIAVVLFCRLISYESALGKSDVGKKLENSEVTQSLRSSIFESPIKFSPEMLPLVRNCKINL